MMKQWTSEEIKEFRKHLGLYQKDFAELIGVTRLYVIYLEKAPEEILEKAKEKLTDAKKLLVSYKTQLAGL